MAMKLDNIHYSYREIDGYNKAFNFVMSPREPGKTTNMWVAKIYYGWLKDSKPWIYTVRQSVEITEAMIETIFAEIQKFTDTPLEPEYNKGTFKEGIVDVKLNGKMFIRIISLSIQMRRIKLAKLVNIKGVFTDEYIIDPKTKEKYLTNEAFKIKEAYSTWRRESEGVLKWYFAGNPYSLYNPLFIDWNVEVNKLRKGEFYVGGNFVIQWATLNPLLREKLLRDNPLYEFDEDYAGYALEGSAINDANIPIGIKPESYKLSIVFKYGKKYIGIFKGDDYNAPYYAEEISTPSKSRDIYCFEFDDLVERGIIMSFEERRKLQRFKDSMRTFNVIFSDINIYYMIIEIYNYL